jgi:hypothetical protein
MTFTLFGCTWKTIWKRSLLRVFVLLYPLFCIFLCGFGSSGIFGICCDFKKSKKCKKGTEQKGDRFEWHLLSLFVSDQWVGAKDGLK